MYVDELRPESLAIADFPGFARIRLTRRQLETIVRRDNPTWRSALSSVAGIYIISDTLSGKCYVGSATGNENLWARWSAYAKTGHGGNTELKKLMKERGNQHVQHFEYGVLEIADTHATVTDTLQRESHWKNLLLTRHPFGYNAN